MSPKIRLLSEQTINQIAAGEVIENPASVVKELVENAIDAGAGQIDVEIQGGGYGLIRICDDGHGMGRNDALLSLERHATSKIRSTKDLEELTTMGFRGEALAAIAAVSKLMLVTSDGTEVTRIEVEGGKTIRCEPAARAQGTTIEVRSLFYNVPARKKFQKSPARSHAEVNRLMMTLSLAYPHVGFQVLQGTDVVLQARKGQSLAQRIPDVLGADYCQSNSVALQQPLITVEGVVGEPQLSRPTRTGQYLFINQRAVQCPCIQYAVKDAYATRLDKQRHPIWVLHVRLAPHLLDVNVHPQKREVRLRDEQGMRAVIQQAVSQALKREEASMYPLVAGNKNPSSFLFSERSTQSFSWRDPEQMPPRWENLPAEIDRDLPFAPRAIGLFTHYLLLEASSLAGRLRLGSTPPDGIVIVDLLAVQARLAFDALLESQEIGKSQGLLLPFTVALPADEVQILLDHIQELEHLGFNLRSAGPRTVLVDAIPPFLPQDSVSNVLIELIESLSSGRISAYEQMAQIAAPFARTPKKIFTLQEALLMFQKLLTAQDPYHCPQGKPTMVSLYAKDIAQYFSSS